MLEAMSMARPVVLTAKGVEGISAEDGRDLLVADDPQTFAAAVLDLLAGSRPGVGDAARRLVRSYYA